jgi:hypothetical protein
MEPQEGPAPGGTFWCKCPTCLKKNRGSAKKVSSSTFYLHNPRWKAKQREAAAVVQAVANSGHDTHPKKRPRCTSEGNQQPNSQGSSTGPRSQPGVRSFHQEPEVAPIPSFENVRSSTNLHNLAHSLARRFNMLNRYLKPLRPPYPLVT